MSQSDIEFSVVTWSHGASAPPGGDGADPGGQFTEFAQTAEVMGFDAVMVGEHIAFPEEIEEIYPYTGSHESPFTMSHSCYELFSLLSFMAGRTEQIAFSPNVLVPAYRHPVELAKLVLTLQTLSDDRLELGIGAGWLDVEFELLEVPFEERGSRANEFLEVLERAYEDQEFAFDGPHHSFTKTGFHPVPDVEPFVWIGGHSDAAFRRLAEYGDGWSYFWTREELEQSTPEAMADWREQLLDVWEDHGRDSEPAVCLGHPVHVGTDYPSPARTELGVDPTLGGDTHLFGDPDDVIADIQAYVDAGVDRLNCSFPVEKYEMDRYVEQMRRFGEEVLPSFT